MKDSLKVFIRADSSPIIGMGHISRCLAIGLALQKLDTKVCFVVCNQYSTDIIHEYGFDLVELMVEKPYTMDEIQSFSDLIRIDERQVILVDSYDASDTYLLALEQFAPTVYIDGLYRCKADISGIVNYNAAADISEYRNRFKGKSTKLFIGLEYTPVKDVFIRAREEKEYSSIKSDTIHVLLTTGSTDHLNLIEELCKKWINGGRRAGRQYHIVLGNMYDKVDRINALAASHKEFHVYHNLNDMGPLMCEADLAVSSAGTTVYELLCVGVPSIVFGTVDIHSSFRALEPAIVWVGDLRDDNNLVSDIGIDRIITETEALIVNGNRRLQLIKSARNLIDGKGAIRLGRKIQKIGDDYYRREIIKP